MSTVSHVAGDVVTAAQLSAKLVAPVAEAEMATYARQSLLAGNMNQTTIAAGATNYISFFGAAFSGAEVNSQIAVPQAGRIRNFRIRTSSAQNAGGSLVFTLRKNAADTTVVATVAAGAAAGQVSDTSNSFTVVAGDQLAIKVVNNYGGGASAGIVGFSVEYDI